MPVTLNLHPLSKIVLAMFEVDEDREPSSLDVTAVAHRLGAPSRPKTGLVAYKIVAGDVLEILTLQALLVRHQRGPGSPEDGGFWYGLPNNADGS